MCPQLSEVYCLRKPSTIRVTQLLYLDFHIIVDIRINTNNGSTLSHSDEWIQQW
jgi:hypothetical protein